MIKKRMIYLYIAIMLLIIFVTKIIGIELPALLVDAIVVFSVLFMSEKDTLYSFIFLLPLSPCFTSSAHIWLIYIIAILVKGRKFELGSIVCAFIFIVLELFAHFYYGISDVNRMLGYLSAILIFIFLICEIKNAKISFSALIKIYCMSVPVLIAFYFLSALSSNSGDVFKLLFVDGARFGGTAGEEFSDLSININANTLAYYCISEVTMVMIMIREGILKYKQKLLFLLAAILAAIVGLLTGSRTFVIVLVVCIVLFWICSLKDKKKIIISSATFLILCVLFVVLINSGIPAVESLLERFGRDDVATMNGRTDILSQYMDLFFSNDAFMFFGSGVTDYGAVFGLKMAIHNGIAQALICYGIFGFLVFMYLIIRPVIVAVKNRKLFYCFIPLIACFIFIQTIQLLNPCVLLFPFAIAYVPLLQNSKKIIEDKNDK